VNFESIGAGKPVLFLLYRDTYGISKVPNEVCALRHGGHHLQSCCYHTCLRFEICTVARTRTVVLGLRHAECSRLFEANNPEAYDIRSLFSSSSNTLKVKVKVKVKGLPVYADAVSERLQTNEMSCLLTDVRTLHLLHNRKRSPVQAVWLAKCLGSENGTVVKAFCEDVAC